VTTPARRIARRLGRRGQALLVLGLAFLFVGIETLLSPDPIPPDRFLLHALIPSDVRAAIWIVSGGLAIAAAWRRGGDGFGFAALVVPLVIRSVSLLWSTVAYLVGATSWPLGWTGAIIWLLLLALVLLISGWAEAPPLPVKHRHRRPRRARVR
jgi:hypothetical protein